MPKKYFIVEIGDFRRKLQILVVKIVTLRWELEN